MGETFAISFTDVAKCRGQELGELAVPLHHLITHIIIVFNYQVQQATAVLLPIAVWVSSLCPHAVLVLHCCT